MLNGAYGRFGSRLDNGITKIIKKEHYDKLALKYEMVNDFELTDNTVLVDDKPKIKHGYSDQEDEFIAMSKDIYSNRELEQSLPIAIATTAYSRIYMNMIINFLEQNNIPIYYTDQDCLWIAGELPEKLVGESIGQFKLEFIADESDFPLPKVYYCKGVYPTNNDIQEIPQTKGLKSGSLSREQYITLSKAPDIAKADFRLIRNFKDKTVKYHSKSITIKPLNNKLRYVWLDGRLETSPLLGLDNIVIDSKDSDCLVISVDRFQLITYKTIITI